MKTIGILEIAVLSFVSGCIVTYCFPEYGKNNIKNKLLSIKNKFVRFIKHVFILTPIFISLVIAYLVFNYFNYGNKILPNLICTALSVVIIDFLIKERKLSEREKLDMLLKNKLEKITKNVRKILLTFIEFDSYENGEITTELLKNILKKEDLNHANVKFKDITEDGEICIREISKFDYLFYIGKELRTIVDNVILNYGNYLNNNQICELINLENILSKKIFKVKISTIGVLEDNSYDKYEGALVETLVELYKVCSKLKY